MIWWWSTVAVTVLFTGWWVGALGGAGRQRRRAAAFARRSGLTAVTPELVRRVARRQRFVFAGAVLGVVACALVDLWLIPVYAGFALGAVADAASRPGPAPAAGLARSLTLARLVVGRRQPAGTPDELAVDDALRAQAVRDQLQVTAVVSFAVSWLLALALDQQGITGPARPVAGWLVLVLLVGMPVVGTVHEFTGGPRHWRRRLHREPVAA